MVATGVADRARDRVVQLIYLDAFVPMDGQSLLDLNEPARQQMLELAKSGDGWRVPPNPTPPDTSQADVEWLTERRVFQPIKCFEMPLKLRGGELTLPRSYIYATRATPADTFSPFAERAKSEAGWRRVRGNASRPRFWRARRRHGRYPRAWHGWRRYSCEAASDRRRAA